jgi:lipopolysaccharide/colanic/teichoic acid biosynthesis glycosyltransferase
LSLHEAISAKSVARHGGASPAPTARARLSQSTTCQLLAAGEAVFIAIVIALAVRRPTAALSANGFWIESLCVGAALFIFSVTLLSGASFYDRFSQFKTFVPTGLAAALVAVGVAALAGAGDRLGLLCGAAAGAAAVVVRVLTVSIRAGLERQGRLGRLVAVAGTDIGDIQTCIHSLRRRQDVHIVFIGSPASLLEFDALARRGMLDEIVLADATATPEQVSRLADLAVTLVQRMPEGFPAAVDARRDGAWNMPAVILCQPPLRGWNAAIKRIIDIAGALAALAFLGIPMLAVAIIIRLESPGPAIFVQERVGFRNARFRMYKFRSMRNDQADATGSRLTLRDDPRVTKFGNFIRGTSIDELPQILNVLKGDMSLVGPRPHPLAAKAGGVLYDELIPNFYSRYRMKPGITGLAQAAGLRGNTETEESLIVRFGKDVEYANTWTPTLDIAVIIRTIIHLAGRKNAF